jgi:hypothetical protein
MTDLEAGRIFSIFIELLDTIQTSVYKVDHEHAERLILRKTFATHYAACSWPLDSVTGFLPYSLALENKAVGCRHSVGVSGADLVLCIAAPNIEALHQALVCVYETNVFFLGAEGPEPPQLSIWVRGPNGRNQEILDYRGGDLGQIDFTTEVLPSLSGTPVADKVGEDGPSLPGTPAAKGVAKTRSKKRGAKKT